MSKMKNLYYFYGSEDFLISEEIQKIRKAVSGDGQSLIKVEGYTPDTIDIKELAGQLCTVSLFSENRLVVLSDFDDEELLGIIEKCGNFSDSVTVMIVSEKADKRTRLYKILNDVAQVKEFKPFAEWESKKIMDWIVSKAAVAGKKIDPKAAELLNEISGPSLRQISSELDKLATYAGERGTITVQDVDALAVSGELGAFALENALAERDLKSAIFYLNKSLRSKEPVQMLISRIASRMRTYLMIKSLKMKKMTDGKIISELSMNPYYYERCSKSAELYSAEEMINAIRLLSETDIQLKSTSRDPQIAMELLLADMIGKGQ